MILHLKFKNILLKKLVTGPYVNNLNKSYSIYTYPVTEFCGLADNRLYNFGSYRVKQ